MPVFTSRRERRLWLGALAVVVAVYSTVALAGTLAETLRAQNLLGAAFALGFLVVIVAVVGSALGRRPRGREVWLVLGVATVYAMVVVRMGISPEERTHLFEYGLLALLVYEALTERIRNGRRIRAPAVVTVVVTALAGWLDEGLQALLPQRVYDFRDVGVNALAGFVTIVASLVLARMARWRVSKDRPPP